MTIDPDAAAFHSYVAASVDLSGAHLSDTGVLTVVRSVRDIDANKRRQFLYTIDQKNHLLLPPQELPPSTLLRLPSPSGSKTAVFQQTTSTTGDFLLEIYHGDALVQRIPLPSQQGKIIADGQLGSPCWNKEETALVYTAERLPPKTCSFFDVGDHDIEGTTLRGAQHTLGVGVPEHWGEKFVDRFPLTDLYLVANGKISRVANVPPDTLLGQPIFDSLSSIVYTGWNATAVPRRLGFMYCQQRPSQLYRSSIADLLTRDEETVESSSPYTLLTPHSQISHSPVALPDGRVVFLTHRQGFATHAGCFALAVLDSNDSDDSNLRIIVDVVHDPVTAQRSNNNTVMGLPFAGFYNPQSVHVLGNEHVLVNTQWGSCEKIVRVSLRDGSLQCVRLRGDDTSSDKVLCVNGKGGAICVSSLPNQPAALYHVSLDQLQRHDDLLTILATLGPMAASTVSPVTPELLSPAPFKYEIITTKVPKIPGVEIDNDMQSILLLPTDVERPSLIVVPHGGPHSVSSTTYMPGYAFLCGHGGYAILFVNYRGSTGFGHGLIEALPGKIGTLDVQDVLAAIDSVRDRVQPRRIGICGGSHGGFLAAHLSSRYPDIFNVAVLRNPVINIPAMVTATDIPDWCHVEAYDGSYHWDAYKPLSEDQWKAMYAKSPIQHVGTVKAPTLVALGVKDLRVPHTQGLEWFYSLRSRGIPTKLLMYENDVHAIDGVESEADHFVNIKKWFDEHF